MTEWGAERLTREELLILGARLRSGWEASVRQANRSLGVGQMCEYFAVAHEVRGLWGEAADELIARREAEVIARREAQIRAARAVREPEAGS